MSAGGGGCLVSDGFTPMSGCWVAVGWEREWNSCSLSLSGLVGASSHGKTPMCWALTPSVQVVVKPFIWLHLLLF